jgi:hypothetical protein
VHLNVPREPPGNLKALQDLAKPLERHKNQKYEYEACMR